jgi:hypothetical protein
MNQIPQKLSTLVSLQLPQDVLADIKQQMEPSRWFHAQYSPKKVEEEKEKESWLSRFGTEDKLAIIIRAKLEFLATLILQLDVKIVNRIVVLLTASLCHGINCCPAERGNIVPNPTWWRWWWWGGGGAGAEMQEL